MMDDPYLALTAGAQAIRRLVERETLGLGGVLGVAAEPYPHQLATARRILTDTRIRHLIADEVGLGKTVQALMILNALRIQEPLHSTVIVAPDRLIGQWQSECWTRCHVQASVFESEGGGEHRVRLVRPQSLQSGTFVLDPATTDLLVVDELQTMPVAVVDTVERLAPDFRQLLLLSATPGLGDPDRRLRLIRMLEPERVRAAELSGRDPLLELDTLDAASLSRDEPVELLFQTWCRTRRVIRASRADWGRYLPARRYHRLDCEPLGGEVDRIRSAMRWLREDAGEGVDAWRFAQALHRSRRSARQVISRQSRQTAELRRAAESLADPGDSRLDALIDVLGRIWSEEEEAQVIVVAGDNPTIDHLSVQLPRYLSPGGRPLAVAALRRAGEALESEVDDIRTMQEELGGFARGESRILLIGEWIQAGLNLQHFSGHLVFHNPPWEPEAIDQLIGRLDRLRPGALASADHGREPQPVTIWVISQSGTPGAAVIDALETLGVFERPLPPASPVDMEAVREALRAVVDGRRPRNALNELSGVRDRWRDGSTRSPLELRDPHTAVAAQASYDRLQSQKPPEPVLERSPRRNFTQRREEALRGFTDLLGRMRLFDVGSRTDLDDESFRFSTIWYSGRPDAAPVRLAELEHGRSWMAGHQPFIWRRSQMQGVPRRLVRTDEGEENGRPLRFLDDGDSLHDNLLESLVSESARALGEAARPQLRTVLFPPDHAMLAHQGRPLLLMTAHALPVRRAMPRFPADTLRRIAEEAPTEAQRATLLEDIERARDGWQADQRWFGQHAPAFLTVDASVLEDDVWRPLEEHEAWNALRPFARGDHKVAARCTSAAPPPLPAALVNRALSPAVRRLAAKATDICERAAGAMAQPLTARVFQCGVESKDLSGLRGCEADRRRAESIAGQEQFREGRIAAAERRQAFAEQLGQARSDWLTLLPFQLRSVRPEFRTLLIQPAPRS